MRGNDETTRVSKMTCFVTGRTIRRSSHESKKPDLANIKVAIGPGESTGERPRGRPKKRWLDLENCESAEQST